MTAASKQAPNRGSLPRRVVPPKPIPVHTQLTCPKCGGENYRGTIEWVMYLKCDDCGHIWQWINRLPAKRHNGDLSRADTTLKQKENSNGK